MNIMYPIGLKKKIKKKKKIPSRSSFHETSDTAYAAVYRGLHLYWFISMPTFTQIYSISVFLVFLRDVGHYNLYCDIDMRAFEAKIIFQI